MPDFRKYAVDVPLPGRVARESTRQLGQMLRDIFVENRGTSNFRLFCPDETNSNRLGNVFEVEKRVSSVAFSTSMTTSHPTAG
jgi:xylulose-5-phosphate/fructose-6-phosphate phosphoketolase